MVCIAEAQNETESNLINKEINKESTIDVT